METILNSGVDLITLYAISNLIRFYENIINQIVKGGQLEECILGLHSYSENAYLNALSAQVKTLLQGPPGSHMGLEPPQTSLIPPQNVARLLSVLKEILSVASMVESRQTDIIKVIH